MGDSETVVSGGSESETWRRITHVAPRPRTAPVLCVYKKAPSDRLIEALERRRLPSLDCG